MALTHAKECSHNLEWYICFSFHKIFTQLPGQQLWRDCLLSTSMQQMLWEGLLDICLMTD